MHIDKQLNFNHHIAITCAIKWTSQIKLFKELGFESLRFRKWLDGCILPLRLIQ